MFGKRSGVCGVLNEGGLAKRLKAGRMFTNCGAAVFLLVMVAAIVVGIRLADSSLITFVCSCAAGLCCSYITGWYFANASEKKNAALLELNCKIDKIDYYLDECEIESSLFGAHISPRRISLYSYDEENSGEFFLILNRMSSVFKEIADCEFCDFDQIEVEFCFGSNETQSVKLREFGDCIERYCEDSINAGGISFTCEQINIMLMNVMVIKAELANRKRELIRQRDQVVLG